MLERAGVDLMIVGRGGGSIEDLWAFNEEEVARAIFECQVPVISAVGHETDTTIADYVADLRAPTPSAAAELAVYDYYQIEGQMQEYRLRMQRTLRQKVQIARMQTEKYQTKLMYLHPRNKLRDDQQRLVDIEEKLRMLMTNQITESKHRLLVYAEKMKGLSPLLKLSQGYSYVQGADGKAVRSISQAETGDVLSVYVTDGIIRAKVEEVKEEHHG